MGAPTSLLEFHGSERSFRARTLISFVRLKWFIHLRWVMIAAAFAVVGLERALTGLSRPQPLFTVLALLLIVNFFWCGLSYRLQRLAHDVAIDAESSYKAATVLANAQIAVDLLLLTAILRYTGGVESPLAIFYLFHMAIAALLLTRPHVYFQAVWALALYAALALGELTGLLTPHYPFLPTLGPGTWYANTGFVFCAVLIVACGILGMLYFVLQIAGRVESHERALARANSALRFSQQKLVELQARKAEFMRTAAHQLKSPLAIVETQVGLLREGLVPANEVRPLYDRILSRCREGILQVTRLLTFARLQELESTRTHATCESHIHAKDAARILREQCDRQRPVAEEKSIQIRFQEAHCDDVDIEVEPTDFLDCTANLIDNAIKYTPNGGEVNVFIRTVHDSNPRGAASTMPDDSGSEVLVTVSDTGIGMGEETRAHLFEPYRRGVEAIAAQISGSGLGMSIVQAVVERSGGRIDVDSAPGMGSRFTLHFPAVRASNPDRLVAEK